MFKADNTIEKDSVAATNMETTRTMLSAVFTGNGMTRLRKSMEFIDVVASAAHQVKTLDACDLTTVSPYLHLFKEKYTAGEINGKPDVRYKFFVGYRLGDIGIAPGVSSAFDAISQQEGRGVYERACSWLTSEGLYVVPQGMTTGAVITDPLGAADKNGLVCLAPYLDNDNGAMDPMRIRDVWSRRVNSEFLPICGRGTKLKLNFDENWLYSKTDIFTMTIHAAVQNIMTLAAKRGGSNAVDWILYEVYKKGLGRESGNSIWDYTQWTKRSFGQGDVSAFKYAYSLGEALSFNDFLLFVPPMPNLFITAVSKKTDFMSPAAKFAERNSLPSNDKNARIGRSVVIGYFKNITEENSKKQKTLIDKAEAFFASTDPKMKDVINFFENNMDKLRDSPEFKSQSKDRLKKYSEAYKTNVPENFREWLRNNDDFGALIDGLSSFESEEYKFVKEYAQQESIKKLDDINI